MEQPQIKSPTPSLVHQLYTKILEHRYGATAQNNTLDCFRLVVGSTIVTHERIAIETLGALLGLTPRSTRSSLNCLQSFIYIASWDNTLRIKYPSFEDFLTNKEACPPRFLINSAEQHTILARCCISIMNQLFQSYKVPEGDHVTYAICHFAEHLLGSAAESRMEFLENVRTFAHSQVTKWLVCLFQEVSHEHAIPSIKKVYQWVADTFPGETELVSVLKGLVWCIPQYYDDKGMQAARCSLVEEASEWWSAAEKAYIQVCDEKDDFLRKAVCTLGLDGRVEMLYTVSSQREMVDAARLVVEKVVIHRCSLAQREELANNFLWGLCHGLGNHQRGLAIWVGRQRVDLVSSSSTFTSEDIAISLNRLGSYITYHANMEEAIEHTQHLLKLHQAFLTTYPNSHQDTISEALHKLGHYFGNASQWKCAANVMEASLEIYQLLCAENSEYRRLLACSLHSLGWYLFNLTQYARAEELLERAVELRQVLLDENPEIGCRGLAQSLSHLGNIRFEMKELTEATQTMERSITMRRVAFAKNPDTQQEHLAWSLHRLGHFYSKLKNWKAAVRATAEAIELYQTLFSSDPPTYRPPLALSLAKLATYHAQLGEWTQAVSLEEKAAGLREELFAQDPDVQRKYLDWSLHCLEFYHLEAGNQAAAAIAREKLIKLRHALSTEDVESHRVNLASWTNSFAWHLRESGRPDKGLKYAEESINMIRAALSMELPAVAFCLTCSLDTAAACLHDAGRFEEALVYSEEAVGLNRVLLSRDPEDSTYRKSLVKILDMYGKVLRALGRTETAEKVVQEATSLQV